MRYDPDSYDGIGCMPTLYARSANDALNQWTVAAVQNQVVVEWGQVGGQLQRAAFDCEEKNVGRANATTAEEQAVKEAIAKWKKQIKKKYFMSQADAESSLNLKPMLAHEYQKRVDKGKVQFPVDVQPKLDGVRCFAYRKDGALMLQSRGGDPYVVHHIRAILEPVVPVDTVLDGELYIHGMPLQNIVSLVKRPQEESRYLTYRVYDIARISEQQESWTRRKAMLDMWFSTHDALLQSSAVQEVETVLALYPSDVQRLHDAFVRDGYEGAIIRQHHGKYRFGYRSHELLKLKAFKEEEFLILGWGVGKGKFLNVPIYRCATKEGKEFDVTPRGTDEERAKLLDQAQEHVGQMLTVRFFQWTNDNIPQFPVGICIREPGT